MSPALETNWISAQYEFVVWHEQEAVGKSKADLTLTSCSLCHLKEKKKWSPTWSVAISVMNGHSFLVIQGDWTVGSLKLVFPGIWNRYVSQRVISDLNHSDQVLVDQVDQGKLWWFVN